MEYFTPLQFIDVPFHLKDQGRNLQHSPFSPLKANFGSHSTSEWNSQGQHRRQLNNQDQIASHQHMRPRSSSVRSNQHLRRDSSFGSTGNPLISSLYSHSNISGEFKPPNVHKRSAKSLRRQRKGSIQRTSFYRKTPVRSLIRSRMKLWNVTWLGSNLYKVLEERELEDRLYEKHPTLKLWSSEPLRPCDLYDWHTLDNEYHFPQPVRHRSDDWPTDPIPPCPLAIIDEGSDSSSDEDLDSYDFDLSSCLPTPSLDLDGAVDIALDNIYTQAPRNYPTKPTKSNVTSQFQRPKTPNLAIRRGDVHEIDITSVYASIMRDSNLMRPTWM